ncbi:uncharaterized LOC112694756 homolog isoform X5 [Canis lupus familiaris]|uniref:uncharaterized LOC112694756 homolog isoform X5 n=1 Tax=Canis lupus familiaris TaxID=9615 RepID=UPI0018F34DF8|nr:uncharaterized LOC112694756 homolog isoform X5 [Canis lupus familiaris]XP_038395830.1 uncharaterized LOC112694756 homolog isoform X5 [Canis lupus familiaris]
MRTRPGQWQRETAFSVQQWRESLADGGCEGGGWPPRVPRGRAAGGGIWASAAAVAAPPESPWQRPEAAGAPGRCGRRGPLDERGAESANWPWPGESSSWTDWPCPDPWTPRAAAQTAAPPAGSKAPPGPRTVAGPVQKPAISLCLAQPTAWMPAAPSPPKLSLCKD